MDAKTKVYLQLLESNNFDSSVNFEKFINVNAKKLIKD